MKKIRNIHWTDIEIGRDYEVAIFGLEMYHPQVLEMLEASSTEATGRTRDGYLYKISPSDSLIAANFLEMKLFELYINMIYYDDSDSDISYDCCSCLLKDWIFNNTHDEKDK